MCALFCLSTVRNGRSLGLRCEGGSAVRNAWSTNAYGGINGEGLHLHPPLRAGPFWAGSQSVVGVSGKVKNVSAVDLYKRLPNVVTRYSRVKVD